MHVEIAICTWNRAPLLTQTLNRLRSLTIPQGVQCDVVVVDNNSTDDTAQVICRFEQHMSICRLHEPRQGHVFARNRAIEHATGELLLWLDDDVVVGDKWLASYVNAARNQDSITFWGGPIRPEFDHHEPPWIREHWEKLSGCFAFRDLGDQEISFAADVLPYGANFGIRTVVQKEFLFSTDRGRNKMQIVGEDELDLFRRLLHKGCQGRWLPPADVKHIIDVGRTSVDYVRRYFYGQGRALVAKGQAWSTDVRELKRQAKHEAICFQLKRYFARSEVWLSHLIHGALADGQAKALQENKFQEEDG